jgi:SAM-dependent methyltransferase
MAIDKLELYRWAVQDPETHVAVLERMYRTLRNNAAPQVLREDFAGTSAEAVAWVAAGPNRQALAIDLDASTIAWARKRAERLLGERAGQVSFYTADVLSIAPPKVLAADVISALNFSVLYFHEREALQQYLEHARQCLAPGGILVANLFGGPGGMRVDVDRRQVTPVARTKGEITPPPFEYHWEQRRYDAVTGQIDCRIHFLPGEGYGAVGGTLIRDAFCYDWRLWTLPEIVDLMRAAGFADVQGWRHTYDPSRGAAGVFLGAVEHLENLETWVAYVVGLREAA